MLDRGLRGAFPAGRRARGAEARRARRRRRRAERARPARPADVHDRPGHGQGLRRRDLAPRSSTARAAGASGSTSPTSAPTCAPGSARRPRGLPARDERLRPRRGRADAARGAVQRRLLAACRAQDRLAVTVEIELRGARGRSAAAFYRSLIRSDERLDYDRVDRIFAGEERAAGAVGRAAGRRAGGGRRAARPRARRGRAGGRVAPSRSSLRRRRPRRRRRRRRCRPSRTG